MYCHKCGKSNSEDNNYCVYCGAKFPKLPPEEKKSEKQNNRQQNGLTGWLALLGLGLIIGPFLNAYNLYTYLPYFNKSYNIPGFASLLLFEFIGILVITIINIILIPLYFKKNIGFRKTYLIFQISTIVFVVVDYLWMNTLIAPTPEQQKILTDAVSNNTGEWTRTLIIAFLWILYVYKSKRVKATFIHK